MKAMILAAGRGERMRPLTAHTPKPLLSAGERLLIENHLYALSAVGVTDVVINVAYFAQQIVDTLEDGARYGVHIEYSREGDEPLGTGAGILHALPLLGDQPFILISADIWTDYSFVNLLSADVQKAHLVMVNNPAYHAQGDFSLIDGVVAKGDDKLTYGGIAVIHPSLFAQVNSQHFSLAPLFEQYIDSGEVTGEYYQGAWFNVGTPQELEHVRSRVTTRY